MKLIQAIILPKLLLGSLALASCSPKHESTFPELKAITESVYASGTIRSEDQYQAFAAVSGVIQHIFVEEGDVVNINDPILKIAGDAAVLSKESASIEQRFAAEKNLKAETLKALSMEMDMAKIRMDNDSLLLTRQKDLWKNFSGTLNDLEQREINSKNSTINYESLVLKYRELKRQLRFDADHAAKNLQVKSAIAAEYLIRSKIKGKVYDLLKEPGEIVTSQSALALLGDARHFLIELQVDENDISAVRKGQRVLVHMDSYKGKIYEAVINKIGAVMDESSRSFLVEARFLKYPAILYPNLTAEANIIIRSINRALLIPRSYVVKDKYVILASGEKRTIRTGLKDYQHVQVLSGLTAGEKILKPAL